MLAFLNPILLVGSLFYFPIMILRWSFTPIGFILFWVVGMGGWYFFGDNPIKQPDVPTYMQVEQIIQQKHIIPGSYHPAITIAITNHNKTLTSPDHLWVACDTRGTKKDDGRAVGDYESLVAFEAGPITDFKGNVTEQTVPPLSTRNLEFDALSAPPAFKLLTGENIVACHGIGTTMKQAMAVAGVRQGDQTTFLKSVTDYGNRKDYHVERN